MRNLLARTACFAACLAVGATALFAQPVPLQLGSLNVVAPGPRGREAAEFTPNLPALRAGAGEFLVLLPEGRAIVIQSTSFQDRGNGDVLWKGRVVVEEGSSVLLTLKGGFLVGSIQTQREDYKIQLRGGVQVIERTNRALPQVVDAPSPMTTPTADLNAPDVKALGINPDIGPTAAGDTEIDVMAVYSLEAQNSVGGVAAMEATIQGAVDYANGVFVNSDVQAHYRLVHTEMVPRLRNQIVQEPDGGANLTNLANDVGVAVLRNLYGADLVALFVNEIGYPSGACGGAEPNNTVLGPNPVHVFQETALSCGELGHIYAHENGHLLGMDHDPEHAGAFGAPYYPWSYGHTVPGIFATVMYYSFCGPPCTNIPNFSNPNVSYLGYPTGIADQRDNARTARLNAPVIAAFRPPAPSEPPDAPTGLNGVAFGPQVSLAWFPVATASGYEIERGGDGITFVQIGTSGTNYFTDNNVSSPNTYYYRVRATNIRGASPYSAVKSVTMTVPPAPPSGLTATAEGMNEIRLNWTDGSNNELGFGIELLINGVYEFVDAIEVPNSTTRVFSFSLQPSTQYSFRVFAYTEDWESGRSNVASATTFATNPGVISGFAFNDANKDSLVNIGETPAAKLVIYYDSNGNGIHDQGTPSVTVTDAVNSYRGTNVPYLSAPNYIVPNLPVGLRRICASFEPAKAGKSFCKTITIRNGSTTPNVNFPVVEGRVGVSSLTPPTQTVKSGDEVMFDVQWTHTDGRWVLLKEAIIRFAETETADALQIRFEESTRTFSISNKGSDKFGPSFAPGEDVVLETEDARFYLRDTRVLGTGPTGPSVTLRLAVAFKPKARGKTFGVLLKLSDDNGFVQGFDTLGSVTVTK